MLRSRLPHLRVVPTLPDGGFRWTRDTDVLRRLTAFGYLIGASTAFLSIVTPDPDPSDHRALLILAVLEVAIAGVLAFGGRLPDALIRAICLPGAVVFTRDRWMTFLCVVRDEEGAREYLRLLPPEVAGALKRFGG